MLRLWSLRWAGSHRAGLRISGWAYPTRDYTPLSFARDRLQSCCPDASELCLIVELHSIFGKLLKMEAGKTKT